MKYPQWQMMQTASEQPLGYDEAEKHSKAKGILEDLHAEKAEVEKRVVQLFASEEALREQIAALEADKERATADLVVQVPHEDLIAAADEEELKSAQDQWEDTEHSDR